MANHLITHGIGNDKAFHSFKVSKFRKSEEKQILFIELTLGVKTYRGLVKIALVAMVNRLNSQNCGKQERHQH